MTTLSKSLPVQRHHTAYFSVIATAEPGTMPRVLEIFAKRGLVPDRWLSAIAGPRDGELHMDIQLADADAELVERLAQSINQIVCVQSVLTSEKRALKSA
jgi:acetolactate synthase small subunit